MLIANIGQLVTPIGKTACRGNALRDLYVLTKGYVHVRDANIVSVGPMSQTPQDDFIFDAQNGVALPGLVDPHTHAVFYGTREEEYLVRCQGEKYGKGILTSVEKVRSASEAQLYEFSKRFVQAMVRLGTTTIEIKSGYGLDTESELKLLRVIRRLSNELPVEVVATFCGAHAVPAELEKSVYLRKVIEEMVPRVRALGLAEFGDVFCEKGFFDLDESRAILQACQKSGMGVKIHADELSALGGAELAAELRAVSADHLLHISSQGMETLAHAGVVAVLLPGTAFTLNAAYAPARKMIEAKVPVALGTDFNPGTCLIYSMFFMIALAVLKMKLTVEEALTAATLNAAAAIRRADKLGSLEPGKRADIVILDLENYRQIPYFIGHESEFVRAVISAGKVVYEKTHQ